MSQSNLPALVIGGSGTVGVHALRAFRRLHPKYPIVIGGRNFEKARAAAVKVGTATAASVNLERPDLGLADLDFGAIATLVKDDTLNTLRFAQAKRAGYVSISSALFEIAPEVGQFANTPNASAVLMASNWLAGVSTLAALSFAEEFELLESIRIIALLDEQDVGGEAAHADYDRQTTAVSSALVLNDGRWQWVSGNETVGRFTSIDGREMTSQAFSNLDVISAASRNGVRSARFEFAVGETSSWRRGEPFSKEIVFELSGRRKDGREGLFRYDVVHPQGQAPLTGLGIAVALEHLLGLRKAGPVTPGLYLPHNVIEPSYMLRRLTEFGTQITRP